jgi:hypothetical protein
MTIDVRRLIATDERWTLPQRRQQMISMRKNGVQLSSLEFVGAGKREKNDAEDGGTNSKK